MGIVLTVKKLAMMAIRAIVTAVPTLAPRRAAAMPFCAWVLKLAMMATLRPPMAATTNAVSSAAATVASMLARFAMMATKKPATPALTLAL